MELGLNEVASTVQVLWARMVEKWCTVQELGGLNCRRMMYSISRS